VLCDAESSDQAEEHSYPIDRRQRRQRLIWMGRTCHEANQRRVSIQLVVTMVFVSRASLTLACLHDT